MSLQAIGGDPLDRFPAEDLSNAGQRIKMQEVPQNGNNWCWAASVESVLATFGAPTHRRQWMIASDLLGCPAAKCKKKTPDRTECDKTIPYSRLQELWRDEGFSLARYDETTVSFETIQKEIEHGRPVQVDLFHRHVILVTGWEILADGQRIVYIVDSHRSGKPYASFNGLDQYPGSGAWGPWVGTVLGIQL